MGNQACVAVVPDALPSVNVSPFPPGVASVTPLIGFFNQGFPPVGSERAFHVAASNEPSSIDPVSISRLSSSSPSFWWCQWMLLPHVEQNERKWPGDDSYFLSDFGSFVAGSIPDLEPGCQWTCATGTVMKLATREPVVWRHMVHWQVCGYGRRGYGVGSRVS